MLKADKIQLNKLGSELGINLTSKVNQGEYLGIKDNKEVKVQVEVYGGYVFDRRVVKVYDLDGNLIDEKVDMI